MTVAITPQLVQSLRQKTSSGMMDCKKALAEAGGDLEKAVEILRVKGQLSAAKRSDRVTKEGYVVSCVSENRKQAALVHLGCETDFVARNQSFQAFAETLARHVVRSGAISVNELLMSAVPGMNVASVADGLNALVASIGEKLELGRVAYLFCDTGFIQSYIHPGAKIGVLVALEQADINKQGDLAKDLAMQIAAAAPEYLTPGDVPAEKLQKELSLIKEELRTAGKPEAMLDKIAQGKIGKFYTDVCLLKQAFIKNTDLTVEAHMIQQAPGVKVKSFVRFAVAS